MKGISARSSAREIGTYSVPGVPIYDAPGLSKHSSIKPVQKIRNSFGFRKLELAPILGELAALEHCVESRRFYIRDV